MMKTADFRRWTLIVVLALVSFQASPGQDTKGPAVTLVTGIDAPALEKFAAEELAGQLKLLFEADVTVKNSDAALEAGNIIMVGSPATNPVIEDLADSGWPKDLSGQGHVLKSVERAGETVLIVGGGNPESTLWAVYELGHYFGMRYTLHEDFLPIEKPEFTLADFDQIFEPNLRIRAWRMIEPGAAGQESWGLEEHRKLLKQLAKLKFNRVALVHDPDLFTSEGISVSGDTAGRSVFGGAKVFENPDFANLETDEDRAEAKRKLINGIKREATGLGMTVAELPVGEEVPGLDMLSLAQPKGGVLPQFFTGRLPEKLAQIRQKEHDGFVIQCWIPGNLNPDIYYLSRASFDPKITPQKALEDLVTPICGEGVAARLANGFAAIEDVSALIEKEDPDFAVPDPKMFMEHFESAEPAPEWWAKATEFYGTAVNEMYRGNTRARGGARPFILYHAKYFTFALHYMTAVDAARKVGIAKAAKDETAWVENLEIAVEAMHNALGIYADVARDNSDRGVIAVLNEYAYRPLVEALNEAPLP